jgi:hypothetical protein
MVEMLVRVHGRRRGLWDVEVEKVECGRAVHEGAKKKGDEQWRFAGGRERARGFCHVLQVGGGGEVGLAVQAVLSIKKQRTSSNFALPEGVTLTGWIPSSPVVGSKKRRKV